MYFVFQRLSWGFDETHRGWNSKFSSKSGKRLPLSLTQSWGCDVKVTRGREPGLMHMLFISIDEEIIDVRRYSHTMIAVSTYNILNPISPGFL